MVIPPSEYWDGNDGKWSSFVVRVGNPAQVSRTLISTTGQETWVVLPEGCNFARVPATCASDRGNIFQLNKTTTWKDKGLFGLNLEMNLDYTGNGHYGLDTVGLSFSAKNGPTLEDQVVAGYATTSYYVGMFGIGPKSINFTSYEDQQPSFLTTLKTKNLIPSLSWSYTAGARYRGSSGFLSNLIFGGMDKSLFVPNNMTFGFAADNSRDLVVAVQKIVATGTSPTGSELTFNLLPDAIYSFVDSTIPYIWLPIEACKAFENALGIVWDETSQLYLLNETTHDSLVSRNFVFTFSLANDTVGKPISIALPYASFDLQANPPLVQNTSRYFPLKRAANQTQYTLGRAFLQEAYLTVDYERSNFSLSQTVFSGGQSQVVAIPSVASVNNTGINTTIPIRSSLSTATIAGVAISVVSFFAIIALTTWICFRRGWTLRKKLTPPSNSEAKELEAPADIKTLVEANGDMGVEVSGETAKQELYSNERYELSSPIQRFELPGDDLDLTELPGTLRPAEPENMSAEAEVSQEQRTSMAIERLRLLIRKNNVM
ncbi:MAG: hypothetical protein M1829_005034 [Trizodia sp. TS-e1964]|nr:MAG: hypothetical protein M1829_005034 [Trizodia sp. TS-e1964]